MDDFLNKIKKKLSVDNILDLMKDGKIKEEIKQTLTAGVNLNEKPNPDDFRSCIEVPSLEHSTEEGQSKVQFDENPVKQDATPNSTKVHSILEPVTHVTVENIYFKTAEGKYKLIEKRPEEQLKANTNNLYVVTTTKEETTGNADTRKHLALQLNEQKITDELMHPIKEDAKKQPDEIESESKKSDDGMETIQISTNVLQKTPQLENADKINFEMFLG